MNTHNKIISGSTLKYYLNELKEGCEIISTSATPFDNKFKTIIKLCDHGLQDIFSDDYDYPVDKSIEILSTIIDEFNFESWFETLVDLANNASCQNILDGLIERLKSLTASLSFHDYCRVVNGPCYWVGDEQFTEEEFYGRV